MKQIPFVTDDAAPAQPRSAEPADAQMLRLGGVAEKAARAARESPKEQVREHGCISLRIQPHPGQPGQSQEHHEPAGFARLAAAFVPDLQIINAGNSDAEAERT